MSGSVVSVITKRTFDFIKLQNATTQEVPLCRALDVTGAKQIDLVVRVHSKTINSPGQIEVIVQAISLSGEDPSLDFLNTTIAGGVVTLANVTLTSSLTAPYSNVTSLTGPWGPMVRVILKGTGATAATSIQATLSIDLIVYDN